MKNYLNQTDKTVEDDYMMNVAFSAHMISTEMM